MRKKDKNKESLNRILWIIKITITAFLLSFAFLSEISLKNVNVIISILILLFIIILGIIFDVVGVAMTSVDIAPFHAMNSKKKKGAKVAIKFIQNADKVASICNDVVGDICGIISGSAVSVVSLSIANIMHYPVFIVILIVTALTAALTIGGKAIGKNIAINQSTKIVYGFSKIVSLFYKPKK